MATQIANKFTSYELSPEEFRVGSIYSLPQIQVLQNNLSEVANLKLNLVYDPLNPGDFPQQVAYLQGKLDILSFLIESSKTAEIEMIKELALSRAVDEYNNQQHQH